MRTKTSNHIDEQTATTKEYRLDVKLLCSATESILNLIIECAKEKDSNIQLDRARAIDLLTDALMKFNFRIGP